MNDIIPIAGLTPAQARAAAERLRSAWDNGYDIRDEDLQAGAAALELLSHPTPPPAPEVEAIRQRHLDDGSLLCPAEDHEAMRAAFAQRLFADVGTMLAAYDASLRCHLMVEEQKVKKSKEAYEQRQRAEAAERELAISRAETENVRTNLICVMDERGAAERALQRISDDAPPVGKPHGPYDAANAVTFAREALGLPLRDPTPSAPFITAPDITELTELARAFRNGDAPYESRVYASLLDRAAEELCSRSTPTPPAAPSELQEAHAAIWAMAEDGWLCHGDEGMSEPQQLVSAYTLKYPKERVLPPRAAEEAAPIELARELRELARQVRSEGVDDAIVACELERAAAALRAPGSEAPGIEPRTSYSIKLSAEGDTEIFEDLTVTEAAFLSDIAENLELARQSFAPRMFVTSHPASPAAGKEATRE